MPFDMTCIRERNEGEEQKTELQGEHRLRASKELETKELDERKAVD